MCTTPKILRITVGRSSSLMFSSAYQPILPLLNYKMVGCSIEVASESLHHSGHNMPSILTHTKCTFHVALLMGKQCKKHINIDVQLQSLWWL